MYLPTKKLEDFIKNFGSLQKFSDYTGIDVAILSKLINGERGATMTNVRKIEKMSGLKFEDAWYYKEEPKEEN